MSCVCARMPGPDDFEGLTGVIFDCDGVIVDSLAANRAYYDMVLNRLGLPPMTPEQEAYVHAHHVQESIAHITPPDRLAEAEAARASIDYRDLLPCLELSDGLLSLLDDLLRAGLRLAIHTNRSDTMDLLLDHFGLRPFFQPVMTAAVVRFPKPHPEGALRILDAWNARAEEVAFIGDTSLDEASARAAGVRFWAYKNPALSADLHIDDFQSLAEALRRRDRERSARRSL